MLVDCPVIRLAMLGGRVFPNKLQSKESAKKVTPSFIRRQPPPASHLDLLFYLGRIVKTNRVHQLPAK